jgi:SPP1 gp7 family putative phage head morphogenesis protein
MYRHLDSQLAKVKKNIQTEFNRLNVMGFDELNVSNTKKVTKAMFDRLLDTNEKTYLSVAKKSYLSAKKSAETVGYVGESDEIDLDWLLGVLLAFNLVTGYLYNHEAERKRLRLNEQILTAREHDSRDFYNASLRKTANLWWTQTQQYGIDVVDEATLKAYRDSGVTHVRWVAEVDGRECEVCRERHNEVYAIKEVPAKTHYACRCRLEPVEVDKK